MKTKIIFIALICNLLVCNLQLFAGWELLQNSPTTNDLHSVYFLDDNTGWIAGYNNTIFKTTNSGVSWVQQTSPIASNFECITFVNANTGWACGSGGTVIKTTNGGTNWFSQTFTGVKFNSLNFLDENTGYICGDNGIIWKTINGGSNWVNQPSGITQNLHQIKFINATTGFAVGDYAYILKTSNGGNSWEIKNGPGLGSQIFYSLEFEGNLLYLIASGTLTKYSTNGGESWDLGDFPAEATNSLTGLSSLGYSCVGTNGYIVKTTNGGINWIQKDSPTNQNLYSVHYPDSSNFIWAVGAGGTILKNISNWKYTFVSVHNEWDKYKDIDFINQDTGWVVGGNDYTLEGLILKTTNNGNTWILQANPISGYFFNSVSFTDVNTGYIVGEYGKILKTTNGGANWITQSSNTANNLNSVCFTETNTGYIVSAGGKILKTLNGGANWDTLSSGTTGYLASLYFTDSNTGYVVGGTSVNDGILLKTTNGGTNWISTNIYPVYLRSVYFVNTNTGYSVGNTILKTTNGGANWLEITGFSYDFRSVYFLDANVGYVCQLIHNIPFTNIILKTNNGGTNWIVDEMPGAGLSDVNTIQFSVENNTAVGFTAGNRILRTSFEYFGGDPPGNSGNYPGWVGLTSGTNQHVGGVEYINPFIAFAVGARDPPGTGTGTILRTINGGQSWVRQQSNVNAEFGAVSFADVNNGMAVGYPTFIVHTTNSGLNWVQQTSPTGSSLYDVDMIDANNAFICGEQGVILHTINGGNNWIIQTSGTSNTLNDIEFINQNTATAVGSIGLILRTTNAGASWFTQNSGVLDQVISIDFINVNTGIAITQFGPALRTTNGGANWTKSDTLGYAQKVCFIDSNNAFATGSEGLIYRTTNGGLNWTLQNANTTENFQSVSFTDANNGIIVGQNGTVLRTSNAGVISGTNTSHSRNNLGLPINDFQNTNDSVNVNITDKSTIPIVTRLYLKIDTVLHTNDGDLEFYLEHNGITDTLAYQNGGSGDNFLGTFLNDATNFPLVSGSSPYRGSFKPHKPLSKFNGLNPNGYWKLRIYDRASGNTGTLQAWSLTITYAQIIGITGNQSIPEQFKLYQNYPNPFNPVTKIKFTIPRGNRQDLSVKLRIYDILGREVTTLINQQMMPGSYTVDWNAGNFASGVYFYRIEVHQAGSSTGVFVESKKMVLVK